MARLPSVQRWWTYLFGDRLGTPRRRRTTCRLDLEELEARVTPTVTTTLNGGVLTVATDSDDDVEVDIRQVILEDDEREFQIFVLDKTLNEEQSFPLAGINEVKIVGTEDHPNDFEFVGQRNAELPNVVNVTIDGGPGNDTIAASAGSIDETEFGTIVINAGPGNDTVLASTRLGETSTIDGGLGNDTITAGSGADTITGGPGNDNISGGNGDDTISGGPDNDRLFSDGGNATITGGTGDDLIVVSSKLGETTTLDGGLGNDNIQGGNGDDTLIGGPDTIGNNDTDNDLLFGNGGTDTLFGGAGNDILDDGLGALDEPSEETEEFNGGPGDDEFFVFNGSHTLISGPGNDLYDYSGVNTFSFNVTDEIVEANGSGSANDPRDKLLFNQQSGYTSLVDPNSQSGVNIDLSKTDIQGVVGGIFIKIANDNSLEDVDGTPLSDIRRQ